MFAGFGAAALVIASGHYRVGTAAHMGPGYFPIAVGAFLVLLGLVILLRSLALPGDRIPRLHFRPLLFVLAACAAYGYLVAPLGMVGATAVLVLMSAYAGHEFKWKEALLLSVVMILISALVFVVGLDMPFPLWPENLH